MSCHSYVYLTHFEIPDFYALGVVSTVHCGIAKMASDVGIFQGILSARKKNEHM